jgi:hypothetical protein
MGCYFLKIVIEIHNIAWDYWICGMPYLMLLWLNVVHPWANLLEVGQPWLTEDSVWMFTRTDARGVMRHASTCWVSAETGTRSKQLRELACRQSG